MSIWIGDFDRLDDINSFAPGVTLDTPRAIVATRIDGRVIVYVASSGIIEVFEMDLSGQLSILGHIDTGPGIARVTDLGISQVGSTLFLTATDNLTGQIGTFAIDRTAGPSFGMLEHRDIGEGLQGSRTHVAFTSGGTTYLLANTGNTLVTWRLEADGTLVQTAAVTANGETGLPLNSLRDFATVQNGLTNLVVTGSDDGLSLWSTGMNGNLNLLDTATAQGLAEFISVTAAVINGTVYVFGIVSQQGIATFTVENGVLVEQQFRIDTDPAHTVATDRLQVIDIDGQPFLLVHETQGLALYGIGSDGQLHRSRAATDNTEPGSHIALPSGSSVIEIDGVHFFITASSIWNTVTVQIIGQDQDLRVGTAKNEVMVGVLRADAFAAGKGNDTLFGGKGDDDLFGGNGTDHLYGGIDDDELYGGLTVAIDNYTPNDLGDLLYGGDGNDSLYGAGEVSDGSISDPRPDGRDTLYGGKGNDLLFAGKNMQNDPLDNPLSYEWLEGGAGADSIYGGIGFDLATYQNSTLGVTVDLKTGTGTGGEAAGDTLVDIEHLNGSRHNDVLSGNWKANILFGMNGADRLEGRNGHDTLVGGNGNDTLDGGTGNDELRDDGGGTDHLIGGDGNDTLLGGSETDVLFGGKGSDTLLGALGDDAMTGGGDGDTFRFWFDDRNGQDIVSDYRPGLDKLDLSASDTLTTFALAMAAAVQQGADTVITLSAGNTIRLVGVDLTALEETDFLF